MNQEGFALVFASDENFVRGLAAAMHSALAKLPPAFAPEIYVLDNELSESSRTRLSRVVNTARGSDELRWIPVRDERLECLPTSTYTIAVYSRLLIPELLPLHIRRAVYLDADVLVLQDVSPLFTIDLADAPFGAAWAVGPDNPDPAHVRIRDGDHPRAEFNTGVMVMDLEHWRSTGLGERAVQYAATSNKPLRVAPPPQDVHGQG